jgi:hypothetical protein
MPRVWNGPSQESAANVLLNTMLEPKAEEKSVHTENKQLSKTAETLISDRRVSRRRFNVSQY